MNEIQRTLRKDNKKKRKKIKNSNFNLVGIRKHLEI